MIHKILLSVEIIAIYDYCVSTTGDTQKIPIRIQKCVLALIFANAFEIFNKFCRIKRLNLHVMYSIIMFNLINPLLQWCHEVTSSWSVIGVGALNADYISC